MTCFSKMINIILIVSFLSGTLVGQRGDFSLFHSLDFCCKVTGLEVSLPETMQLKG